MLGVPMNEILEAEDYMYNLILHGYALRTGTQGANARSYRAECRSQAPRRRAEGTWCRQRDEGIGPDCGRLLQAFSEQGRASRRRHCTGILGYRESLLLPA